MKKIVQSSLISAGIIGMVAAGGALVSAEAPAQKIKPMGHRLEVASEVLGIDKEDLKKQLEDSTLEEVIKDNGYDDLDAFFQASLDVAREKMAEKGLSEEEIDKRIEGMIEHRDIREDIRTAREELLGLSKDEMKALHDEGKSFDDILHEQGFESKEDFQGQLIERLTNVWSEEGVSQEDIDDRIDHLEKRGERREMMRGKMEEKAEELGISVEELRQRHQDHGPRGF